MGGRIGKVVTLSFKRLNLQCEAVLPKWSPLYFRSCFKLRYFGFWEVLRRVYVQAIWISGFTFVSKFSWTNCV